MRADIRLLSVAAALLLSSNVAFSAALDESVPRIDAESCSAPAYKRAWQDNDEEGNVKVAVLVDKDGKVISSKMLQSSGYRHLDNASTFAIKNCTFKPGTQAGQPAQSWAVVTYSWLANN